MGAADRSFDTPGGQRRCGKIQVREMKKDSLNRKGRILLAVCAVYACCCVSFLMNMMTGRKVFTQSAAGILLFGVLLFSLPFPWRRWQAVPEGRERNRRIRYVCLLSWALGLSFCLGYEMRTTGMTFAGIGGKALNLVFSLGTGIALVPVVDLWFVLLERLPGRQPGSRGVFGGGRDRYIFPVSWAVIFLCWMPVFLAYYPAIMAYDFLTQCKEAYQGFAFFNTHHPLIHTALIRMFLLLGEALHSYETGMALFSMLQMLALSGVFAWSCRMIGRLTGQKYAVAGALLFFALFPVNPLLAVSTTKDVLFAAFFLLFLLLMLDYGMCGSRKKKAFLAAAMTVSGILSVLFRNNAVYAFAVFGIFWILTAGKERVRIALLCVLILAGGQGAKWGMQTAMGAESGSRVEMCSLFIQQFGRVAALRTDDLSEEDAAVIGRYIPPEYWGNYNPPLSDSIKLFVGMYSFGNWEEDMGRMLGDWMKTGLRYPDEYIDAFLALTCGYWFLDDVSHAEVLGYGEDIGKGILYTDNGSVSDVFGGIETHSYLPWLRFLYQKLINGNSYYSLPVVSNLFKPAFYCWVLLLVMVSFGYLRERRGLVFCLLPFLYLLTLYLGPVVHLRYVYPIMAAVPLLLALLFCRRDQETGQASFPLNCP